jgi:hypothetical protein
MVRLSTFACLVVLPLLVAANPLPYPAPPKTAAVPAAAGHGTGGAQKSPASGHGASTSHTPSKNQPGGTKVPSGYHYIAWDSKTKTIHAYSKDMKFLGTVKPAGKSAHASSKSAGGAGHHSLKAAAKGGKSLGAAGKQAPKRASSQCKTLLHADIQKRKCLPDFSFNLPD